MKIQKRKIILFWLLSFLFSCSHDATKIVEVVPPPLKTIPPIKEITNFDIEFQNNLKEVWGGYFKENFNDSRSLDILIATNRNAKNGNFGCYSQSFGTNEDPSHSLHWGICRVNVPKNHSTGEIEYAADARANSHQFYKIVNAKNESPEKLFDFIKRTKRTPLIFVHGFNVRYLDAVLRASQLSYDLKYQGPILLFSWPSGAGESFIDDKLLNRTYEQNRLSAKASVLPFKNLLRKFYNEKIPVNVVVHSMGHQVVLPALYELGSELTGSEDKIVNELILNAPDFEVNEFQNKIGVIQKTSKRVTLYCSYKDKAMMASSSFNKNERLGACAHVDGVDTINVSLIDDKTFGTGHSYYSSRDIITDVFQVLLGLDVEKRLFMKKSEPNSPETFYLIK